MNKEKIANIIGVTVEQLAENSKNIEEANATYYYNKERGGVSIVVAEDGSYLAANSSVNPDELISEFKNGRRNGDLDPIKDFINKNVNPQDPYWIEKIQEFFDSLANMSEEDKLKLVDKFVANKDLFNEFTKELTSDYNSSELYNKYMNLLNR